MKDHRTSETRRSWEVWEKSSCERRQTTSPGRLFTDEREIFLFGTLILKQKIDIIKYDIQIPVTALSFYLGIFLDLNVFPVQSVFEPMWRISDDSEDLLPNDYTIYRLMKSFVQKVGSMCAVWQPMSRDYIVYMLLTHG